MSRKWVCDECAKCTGRPEYVCMVKVKNPNVRKPERCPWFGGAFGAVWKKVKKSKKEE